MRLWLIFTLYQFVGVRVPFTITFDYMRTSKAMDVVIFGVGPVKNTHTHTHAYRTRHQNKMEAM